jgi:hypothetical protein
MDVFAMAFIAIRRKMSNCRNLSDLVAERGMARGALNLVVRNVVSVKRGRGILRHEDLRFVVAFEALPFGHVAIPLDHAHMTFLAGNSSLDVFPMVEVPSLDVDVPFGLDVTCGAASDCA